jgi:hypothetical protein
MGCKKMVREMARENKMAGGENSSEIIDLTGSKV